MKEKFNLLKKRNSEQGVSIFWVIGTVVALSLTLVALAFISFIGSGAYDTVQQITAAKQSLQEDDLDGYDTTSPLRADTIGAYSRTIADKVNGLDDEKDFNQDLLDKNDLGY